MKLGIDTLADYSDDVDPTKATKVKCSGKSLTAVRYDVYRRIAEHMYFPYLF